MKPNLTDITMLLDRSGSMKSVCDDTIGGVNQFLMEQRNAPGEASFTLFQFDHEFSLVTRIRDIRSSEPLTAKTYVPRGMTALLDAIGRAVTDTGDRLAKLPETERPSKVVFVIVTDGHENSSREYNRVQIFEMIKHQQDKYAWEFVFLGANQDAIAVGTAMGVIGGNTLTYAHSAIGVLRAFEATSKNLRAFRCGTKATMAYEPADIKAQVDAGVTGAGNATSVK